MASYHRTTISVPQDLKIEMEAFDGDVNWSSVAADAFRRTIKAGKPAADSLRLALELPGGSVIYTTDDQAVRLDGQVYPRDLELAAFLVSVVKGFVKHGPDYFRSMRRSID